MARRSLIDPDPMIDPQTASLQLCSWWRRVNEMRDDLVLQARECGNTPAEVAEAMGLHISTIKKALDRKQHPQQ